MGIYVRYPDGSIIEYWNARSVTYQAQTDQYGNIVNVWTIKDENNEWVASIVPMPGMIVSPRIATRGNDFGKCAVHRYSETEQRFQSEIVRLQKIIDENNLKDLKAEKKKRREVQVASES